MSYFTLPMKPGPAGEERHFIATNVINADPPRYGAFGDDDNARDALVQWALARFINAVRAKVPELQRLRTLELYYSGFHWEDPLTNRENAVRNFCFATVETVLPILVEVRPRPEIVLRRQYGDEKVADRLNDFAQWLMDVTEWDYVHAINGRERLKFGWAVNLLQTDDDGLCRRMAFPVWDFYKDPAATTDDDLEHYFLARPVATDWLQSEYDDPQKYPWLFDWYDDGREPTSRIYPDNIVSPGYDALERPYLTAWTSGREHYFDPESIVASVARLESEPASEATTSLVRSGLAERRRNGRTSFLIQMFVRDRTHYEQSYTGVIATRPAGAPPEQPYDHAPAARPHRKTAPCCPSGWRVIQFLADGTFLDTKPLDACYGGRNIEIERDYPQVGRFYPPGELDNVVPINRSINRRTTMLNRALEFEAIPILLADTSAGPEIDNRAVEPGDVIRKQQGSQVEWMQVQSVGGQHFEMLSVEKMDMDTISGVHDVTEGRRPEGIEAASAIRSLQQAAQTRIRGKEVTSFNEMKRMLKKMMLATGRKAKGPIYYRGSDGETKSLDPGELLYEYDIQFAPSSGTVVGRAQTEEKILALHGNGLIDNQTALERLNVKGVPEILKRMEAQSSGAPPVDPAKLLASLAALLKAAPQDASYAQAQQILAMAGVKPQPMDPSQQHLAATQHKKAEEESKPQPAPVIAGSNGKGGNQPRKG